MKKQTNNPPSQKTSCSLFHTEKSIEETGYKVTGGTKSTKESEGNWSYKMGGGKTISLTLIPTTVAFCLGRSGGFILDPSGQYRGRTISAVLGLYGASPFRQMKT